MGKKKEEIIPGDTFLNMILNEQLDNKMISVEKGEFKDFIVYIDKNKRAYVTLFGKEKDLNTQDLLNSTFKIKELKRIRLLDPDVSYFKDGTELVYKLMYDKINELAMTVNKIMEEKENEH